MQGAMGGSGAHVNAAAALASRAKQQSWELGVGILDHPIYSTDEFRINAFKVLSCSNRAAHDCERAPPRRAAPRPAPRSGLDLCGD